MTEGERRIKQIIKKDNGIHQPSGKRNTGERKSSSNEHATRIRRHIVLQDAENVRHLSVLRLKRF